MIRRTIGLLWDEERKQKTGHRKQLEQMAKLESFQDLKVWKRAHELTLGVYQLTRDFPAEEKFGLISQIRRSCSSVPTNIVEGFKRASRKDQVHFYNLAQSSLEETKYHLILSRDLEYLKPNQYDALMLQADEVARMLFSFIRTMAA